ncbi:hypothetical protein GGF43_004507, partial [Coemansia sp. RSA 2618]
PPPARQDQPPPLTAGPIAGPHATLSHDSPTPQTAPPISYSANGTQLLNDPEPGSRNGNSNQQYSDYSHNYSYAHRLPGSMDDYRWSNTGPELTAMSGHSLDASSAAESGQPPHPLQHAATLPAHRYDALPVSAALQNGGSSSQAVGSITIPTSPPLTARSDSYFGRGFGFADRSPNDSQAPGLSAQMQLPPLGSSQGNGRPGQGGSTMLHSSMTFQPSTSSGNSMHAESYAQGRHSAFHHSAQASSEASHNVERQLPSLAELASSTTHGSDSFRYSRQQYPPLEP